MELKFEKLGKLENFKTDEEVRNQNEETLCMSIMKGFARRTREKTCDTGRDGRRGTGRHVH